MCRYRQGGTEPTLDEVIHEPVIRLMMKRDNVTEEALLRIIMIARQHLGRNREQRRQGIGQWQSGPPSESVTRNLRGGQYGAGDPETERRIGEDRRPAARGWKG